MSKIALFIGRFQPIHKGHLKIIERYAKAGFFIKIGVGSANKENEKYNPLSFKERKEMIITALSEVKIKNFQIYAIKDIKEDKNYVKHILKIVGKFNVIITGNPHVLKLFIDYPGKNNWNIESFEESKRPGGNITSGIIRKRWLNGSNRTGLTQNCFKYLKNIDFTKRLKLKN
jgi:nicotinamide-nucleotide adenylyltransferase